MRVSGEGSQRVAAAILKDLSPYVIVLRAGDSQDRETLRLILKACWVVLVQGGHICTVVLYPILPYICIQQHFVGLVNPEWYWYGTSEDLLCT